MTREISGISTSTTKEPKKADGEGDKKLEDQDRIVLMKCGTIDRGEDTTGRRTKNLEGGDIRQTSKRNMKLSSSIGFMFTDKSLDVAEVKMCRRLF